MSPAVDADDLMDMVGGDMEIVSIMLEAFVESCDGQMRRLGEAVTRGDVVVVDRTAHALKGALQSLAAHRAAASALELENMARAGDVSAAAPVYTRFAGEVAEVAPALERLLRDRAA